MTVPGKLLAVGDELAKVRAGRDAGAANCALLIVAA